MLASPKFGCGLALSLAKLNQRWYTHVWFTLKVIIQHQQDLAVHLWFRIAYTAINQYILVRDVEIVRIKNANIKYNSKTEFKIY